ncbi:MAG: NUDIX domain-containing protein [Rhodospirillaceae bacterium]|nr:NUDIX domain-containing protein [Rhodospirillaceae bacterium]
MAEIGPDNIEVQEKRTAYQGYFRIDAYTLRHGRFEGGWHKPMSREVFERGHAAAVLLYEPERGVFLLCEQFRIGAYAGGMTPWQLELVAGIIEPGEKPEDVAKREALEEAGAEVLDLLPISHYLVSPGGATETIWLYLGRVRNAKGGIFGLDSESEHIRVHVVTEPELQSLMESGKIENAQTIIAAQWFFLNRARIRAAWI